MTPKGWQTLRFGDFCREIVRRAEAEELPILSVSKDHGLLLQSEKFKRRIASKDTARYKRIRYGEFAYDPMVLWSGSIGRQTRVQEGIISPAYYVFQVDSIVDPEFFETLLRWPGMLAKYSDISQGTNVRRRKASFGDFCNLTWNIPPLAEQRQIATILFSVEDTIKKTQAVIDQLELVGKGLLEDLIAGKRKQIFVTDKPNGRSPENKGVPQKIGELGQFSGGNGFRPADWSSQGLPIIRIQNLNGSLDFNYYAGEPEPEWIVEPGELLFAWAGSRGSSFGPCIWPGPRGVLNQHIHRIKPNKSINKHFLYLILKQITAVIEQRAHGFKDTLVHLRKSELTEWEVFLPPILEQEHIAAIFDSYEQQLKVERETLEAQQSIKAALLAGLLSGHIRAPLPTMQEAA